MTFGFFLGPFLVLLNCHPSIRILGMIFVPPLSIHRCSLDLSTLKRDVTHDLWLDLEGGAGRLHVLITISGLAQFDDIDAAADGAVGDKDQPAASKRYGVRAYHS